MMCKAFLCLLVGLSLLDSAAGSYKKLKEEVLPLRRYTLSS
ncbi:MAG: hypothetical protein ACPGXY_04840 [Alphaproteobacteria bacterium]